MSIFGNLSPMEITGVIVGITVLVLIVAETLSHSAQVKKERARKDAFDRQSAQQHEELVASLRRQSVDTARRNASQNPPKPPAPRTDNLSPAKPGHERTRPQARPQPTATPNRSTPHPSSSHRRNDDDGFNPALYVAVDTPSQGHSHTVHSPANNHCAANTGSGHASHGHSNGGSGHVSHSCSGTSGGGSDGGGSDGGGSDGGGGGGGE